MARPVATERRRTVGKTYFDPTTNRREKGVSDQTEVVRSAWCGKMHLNGAGRETTTRHRVSSKFEGVVETGWVFWCDDCGTRFVACPPEQGN